MKKIDIHVHTRMTKGINRMGTESTYATPDELSKMYEKLGVEKAVILPGFSVECSHRPQSNEDAYRLVQKYPNMFYWFCDLDPRMGFNDTKMDLSVIIKGYQKMGAKGVGEITSNLYFDNPFVENLFYHCEKTNMPVLFHIGPKIGGCYGLVDDLGLPRLEKALQKYPNLKFIGHSQPFWAEIANNVTEQNRNGYPKGEVIPGRIVELMRKYPNLYGDLSAGSGYNAVSRDPVFGYEFVEEFQDKLFYGTDICAPENEMMLSFWLDEAVEKGCISKEAYEKVSRLNALKLLEV